MSSESNGSASKRRKVLEPSKFRPGFIRKVRVWNFTTYSYTEFNLSPTLNMIIGPNGSGKSTLVASICIGLAGSINLIKRKNLKSMIKTGQEKSSVEITIENYEGHSPIVIKREFTAKESNWTVNNKRATESKIKDIRTKFNIQLDNLCHFLPQERVAEFAGLSPEKLLMETERTLGDGHLLIMHEDLIAKDNESQQLGNKIKDIEGRLAKLHEDRSKLEEEARKLEEYDRKSEEVDNHRLLIPYAKYQDLKNQRTHLKRLRDEAKHKLRTFQANFKPLENDIANAEKSINEESEKYSHLKDSLKLTLNEINQHKSTQKQVTTEISELRANLKSYQTRAEQKKKELEEIKKEIAELQEKQRGLPQVDPEEMQNLSTELTSKRHELRDLEEQFQEVNSQRSDIGRELTHLTEQLRGAEKRLLTKDKLDMLVSDARQNGRSYRLRDEAFDVHKRLRNEPEYEGRYFEAPVISCNVPDINYAAAAEKIIDNNTLFAFTVTNQSDFDFLSKFSQQTNTNTPLRMVNSVVNPTHEYSKHQLREVGFEGYLSDYIVGPKEVLSMLYSTSKIHTIPVSKHQLSSEQVRRLTNVSGNDRLPFTKFVAGDTLYNIQRSKYGSQQAFYITEKIGRSQYFGVQGLSQEAKDAINAEISKFKEKIEQKKRAYEGHRNNIDSFNERLTEIKHYIHDIKRKQLELQEISKRAGQLQTKIELKKEREQKLEKDSKRDYSLKIRMFEQKIDEKYLASGELFASLSNSVLELCEKENQMKLKKLEIIGYKNKKLTAESLLDELGARQEKLKNDYNRYKREYDEIKQSEAFKEIERQNEAYTDEERSRLADLAQVYVENGTFTEATIRLKIDLLEDELSLLTTADRGSIDALKQKLQDIQLAETNLPLLQTEKERLDTRIKGIQEEYEGELTLLVNKISLAFNKRFTKVASDGRVQLAKLERFKDWKLQILVKFRQESELKVLDHQSQSGGERAVSTIFFIMSLQGLTDAPFRIVDEINQGMDPKNEQMAHRYLVHTACQNSKSQYFLVTPKLLTGLYYHPDMVVHCIFTGPYITDNEEKRDNSMGMLDFAV